MDKSCTCGENVLYLKTCTELFEDSRSGIRQFEVLEKNKECQVGDTLILEEFDPIKQRCTGAWIPKRVIYKDTRFEKEGLVILGLNDIKF